jgi:hypothetical protein
MNEDARSAYRAIDAIFINHPRFAWALDEMRDLVELKPTLTAPCIHVSGPSGVGKSTLQKRVCMEYPAEPGGACVKLLGGLSLVADRHRLVALKMPPEPTVKALAREILKAYGDELWGRGDEYTLGDRVDRFIAASQTNAVLIDEAQRAIERTGTVVSEKLIDWIKARHEANSVGFIFLGLGRLRHLFEADRQIERRWDAEIRLEPYPWFAPDGSDDVENQANFIGLLAKFRDLSPVPFAVDVENDHVAYRFYYLSRGLVDGVKKLLLRAVRLMARHDARAFDFPLLEAAAAAAFRLEQNGMQNPFSKGFRMEPPPPLEDDYLISHRASRPTRSKRKRAQAVDYHLTK